MSTVAALALIVVIGAGCIALTRRIEQETKASQPPAPKVPVALASKPHSGGRPPENAVERFVVLLKQKKAMRLVLSLASFALLAGAGAMIGYPFYTNLYQDRVQSRLDRELASPTIREAYITRSVPIGDSLTRIKIPRIGVDTVVVEGTTASALRAGAGHYPSSPLPCEVGNVAIAGHRTTYGRPFHDLDLLQAGDRIVLETPISSCTYEVRLEPADCVAAQDERVEGDHCIVRPTNVSVVANTPDEARLTLTTCHPKGSARERLILTATMVEYAALDA